MIVNNFFGTALHEPCVPTMSIVDTAPYKLLYYSYCDVPILITPRFCREANPTYSLSLPKKSLSALIAE